MGFAFSAHPVSVGPQARARQSMARVPKPPGVVSVVVVVVRVANGFSMGAI